MATLKRDTSGVFVLRFWTAGLGSKLVYRILGRISRNKAKVRADEIIAADKQERNLARPSALFRRITEKWYRR